MQLSKYNIISKIKDSDDWFVVNALSGQADVLDQETYHSLISGEENPEFAENGYLVDPAQEKAFQGKVPEVFGRPRKGRGTDIFCDQLLR